jgi:hypothetical protein
MYLKVASTHSGEVTVGTQDPQTGPPGFGYGGFSNYGVDPAMTGFEGI